MRHSVNRIESLPKATPHILCLFSLKSIEIRLFFSLFFCYCLSLKAFILNVRRPNGAGVLANDVACQSRTENRWLFDQE